MTTIAPFSKLADRVAKPSTPIINDTDEVVVFVPDAIVTTPEVVFAITDDDDALRE